MKRRAKRQPPTMLIIAGPNGAGKTTFARRFLRNNLSFRQFINADLIAQGLSPFAPEKVALRAGRIMLQLLAESVTRKYSVAFETTLSGLAYAQHIPRWRRAGYHVRLVFLSLPSADVAVERVRVRVQQGGHHIPEDVIRRRFDAGIKNFHSTYSKIVDSWALYDSSDESPRLIASGENS